MVMARRIGLWSLALAFGVGLLVMACAPAASQPTAQPAPQPTAQPADKAPAQPTVGPTAQPPTQPTTAPAAKAAEQWPTKPIKIVVPFEPGGTVDKLGRGLAPFLSRELGVPITVENVPGASGQVGQTSYLQQPADGYTLLATGTSYITTNILLTGAKFKVSDFAYVNAQWTDQNVAATGKDKPWKTMGELVETMKTPGKVSAGILFGGAGHVAYVALLDVLGIPLTNVRLVTYDSGGPSRTALAGGQVDWSVTGAEGSLTIKDMVRGLAVFSDRPDEVLNAPPINEALRSYNVKVPLIAGSTRIIATQAAFKTDYPDRWQKLVAAYQKALQNPEYKEWLRTNQVGGEWVGPEKTTQIAQDEFTMTQKYKDLLNK